MIPRLYLISRFEQYYQIRTDSPLEELWRYWLRYCDGQYLSKEWPGHPEPDMMSIATFIRQAFEYHEAAKVTTYLTRPLLIYYSLHNLAKAFLILKGVPQPPPYHGLANATPAADLLDMTSNVKQGIFSTLASTLGGSVPQDRPFTLREFASNAVELHEALGTYYGERSYYLTPKIVGFTDGHIELRFTPSIMSLSEVEALIASFTHLLDDFSAQKDGEVLVLTPRVALPPFPAIEKASLALLEKHLSYSVLSTDTYFIKVAPPAANVPAAAAYLGAMFQLSSVVRYNPDFLDRYIRSRSTSNEWFFTELCLKAERACPNLLLNELHEYPYKFGAGSV